MHIFHKWSKWQEYQVQIPPRRLTSSWGICGYIEHRQKRYCAECGKVQEKIIRKQNI